MSVLLLKSLNYLDYIIITIYLLTMVFIGVFLSRANKDGQDFFKGGSKIPWLMACLSLSMGSFSAYMFVAASGQAYKSGIASLLLYTSGAWPFIVVALCFAHLWRRARITSPMEYVEMRFGNATTRLITFLQIPILLLLCGTSLYVLCIFVSSAFGFTGNYNFAGLTISGLNLCMLVTGVIVLIYTTFGGLWAVVVADTIQFVIVMISSITIFILSLVVLSKHGGLADLLKAPPLPDYFHFINGNQPLWFSLAWISLSMFSLPGSFQMIQRSGSVPDESSARKTNAFAALFFIIAPVIWITPVIIMRKLLPDLGQMWPQLKNPTEASYVTIALMLLPNGMIGITISAILAATVSHIAASYNILAILATRDIYKPLFMPAANDVHLMRIGRVSNFVFAVASIFLGMVLAGHKDAFQTTFIIASHTVIAVSFPLVIGIFVRRIPWWSAALSMVACFFTTFFIEFGTPLFVVISPSAVWIHMQNHLFEYKVFGAIAINFVVFAVAAMMYKQGINDAPKADELFARLKKPIAHDFDAILFVPNLKMYKIAGYTLAPFGIPLIFMSILHITPDPQNINLISGLAFVIIAVVILWLVSARYSPIALVRQQYGRQCKRRSKSGGVEEEKKCAGF